MYAPCKIPITRGGGVWWPDNLLLFSMSPYSLCYVYKYSERTNMINVPLVVGLVHVYRSIPCHLVQCGREFSYCIYRILV